MRTWWAVCILLFSALHASAELYPTRSQIWNLGRAKVPGFDDRKRVNIRNMDPFTIVESRELSRGSKPKFVTESGIEACKKELEQINTEVQKLQVQKQKHIDLARQYQTEGDRWKYTTGRIDDAHAAWGKADGERAKAIDLQRQIDLLLEKKDRIYQFYPQLQYE